jgi:hypothetical protein
MLDSSAFNGDRVYIEGDLLTVRNIIMSVPSSFIYNTNLGIDIDFTSFPYRCTYSDTQNASFLLSIKEDVSDQLYRFGIALIEFEIVKGDFDREVKMKLGIERFKEVDKDAL